MDAVFGIKFRDGVILAGDSGMVHSIVKMKPDVDKVFKLDSHKAMAVAGEMADALEMGEYLQKNLTLYNLRHDLPLSTPAAANYIRSEMAKAIRSAPKSVNMLIGGYDAGLGGSLYFLDYLGSMTTVDYGAHGYAAYFCLGLMDRYYRRDMVLDDALNVIQLCIGELKTRFLVEFPNFVIKVIDANGIRIHQGPMDATEWEKQRVGAGEAPQPSTSQPMDM